MKFTDYLLIALNGFTLVAATVGLASQHPDPMSAALALSFFTALVNGTIYVRRSGSLSQNTPAGKHVSQETDAQLDAYRVLDIDERLEALEQAEARRIRALVDQGVLMAPADESEAARGRGTERERTR